MDDIVEIIGVPREDDSVFIDAFCGTGVVAARAADLGWPIRLNDNLRSAVAIAKARLLSAEQVPFETLGGYAAAVGLLNMTRPVRGYFWREYSPAGAMGRQYFDSDNAARIDAVRLQLAEWERARELSADESLLLRADLIAAAGRVANIAGTYGCFLARWTGAARQPFAMVPRALRPASVPHSAHCGDVVDTPMAENDVAYFDPPYTKRQYAAYYHVNETLLYGDEPELEGKTGLRPWRDKASDYCYKSRALDALASLIRSAPAARIYLSYSSQGHVPLDELTESLQPLGEMQLHELGLIGRYRPNRAASGAGADVTEFLIQIDRSSVMAEAFV